MRFLVLLPCLSVLVGCGSAASKPQTGGPADSWTISQADSSTKTETAESVLREIIALIAKRRFAPQQGEDQAAEQIMQKIDERSARFREFPAAEREKAVADAGQALFREIDLFAFKMANDPFDALGIPNAPMEMDPKWAGLSQTPPAAKPDAEAPKAAVQVVIEPAFVETARDLTRRLDELVSEIERLQGLLWGAEKDGVFQKYNQRGWPSFQPYLLWCGRYGETRVSPSARETAAMVKLVDDITERTENGQATAVDRQNLIAMIDYAGGEHCLRLGYLDGKPPIMQWKPPAASEIGPLEEMRNQLVSLHERVKKLPKYTGKTAAFLEVRSGGPRVFDGSFLREAMRKD